MNIRPFAIAAALTIVTATAAHAAPLVSKSGRVSVEAPKGWKVEAQGDTLVGMEDPAGEAGVLLMVIDQGEAEKALQVIDKLVGAVLTNAKWSSKPAKMNLNGMSAIRLDGTGVMDGKAVTVALIIAGPTPAGKGVIALAGIQTDKLNKHLATVKGVFGTVKPIK
jgi:hypothetical protein